jgi:hypothetical protein
MYSGYRFEEIGSQPAFPELRSNEPAQYTRKEMCCVYQSDFGGFNVLFAAEVDSFEKPWSPDQLQQGQSARSLRAIEMKTSTAILSDNMIHNLNKKMVRWWAQSRLISCSEVICGFRSRDFKLHHIEHYSIEELGRNKDRLMNNCMSSWQFLTFTLQELNSKVKSEEEFYELSYEPDVKQYFTKSYSHKFDQFSKVIPKDFELFIKSFP